jgi:hypothetical protein
VQKSAGKFPRLEFLGWINGILLIDYLPNSQTTSAEYYSLLLVQLHDILKEERRSWEGQQGVFVLARQYPGSPDICNPE